MDCQLQTVGTSPGLTVNVAFIQCFFPGMAVIQEDDKLQHLIIISTKTTWNNAFEIQGYLKDGKYGEYTFNTSFFKDKTLSSLQFI